ncbi:hypothetical protein UFOVP338_44 [uncultured Caudovirales phage]|uniref:Uncharacterized protein n=1 Tax=uncultured Caudovirales phage TaxID=2100421 RepID=A0A6J5LY74_9CAUD|nr:hypothetical protein UFOVP338_44 [uncultured Caudovirales phage]
MAIEFFDTSNISDNDAGGLLAYEHYANHRESTASNFESLDAMHNWMQLAVHDPKVTSDFFNGYKNAFEIIGTGWVRMLKNLPTVDHPKNPMPKFHNVFFPNPDTDFKNFKTHPDATQLPNKDANPWTQL